MHLFGYVVTGCASEFKMRYRFFSFFLAKELLL